MLVGLLQGSILQVEPTSSSSSNCKFMFAKGTDKLKPLFASLQAEPATLASLSLQVESTKSSTTLQVQVCKWNQRTNPITNHLFASLQVENDKLKHDATLII